MKLKVAVDNGNSEQDMYLGEKFIAQPNVFARAISMPNLDDVNVNNFISNIHDNLLVSIEGQTYYVGKYALASGERCRSVGVGVDNNKIKSDIVYINTLAHIAAEALQLKYEQESALNDETVTVVNTDMATAIPVSYYTADNANDFANKFIAKDHTVTIYIGRKSYTVKIIFDFVKVIPEGVTASHAMLNNLMLFEDYNSTHKKKISKTFMNNSRVLHIAIGEGTTEYPVTQGIMFNPQFIDGSNNGNGYAIDRVLGDFKRIYGLQKFTRQDFSAVVRDKKHKYHDTAMELLLPALDIQAEEILDMAKTVIQKANNEIDLVVVYGGGSILMRDSLEPVLKAFCDRAKIEVIYIDENNAVTLEAKGLYHFINSSLFNALKEHGQKKRAMK